MPETAPDTTEPRKMGYEFFNPLATNLHEHKPEDHPEWIWHFWISEFRDSAKFTDHVLCWLATGSEPDWHGDTHAHFTRLAELVNCQTCLEWLHA